MEEKDRHESFIITHGGVRSLSAGLWQKRRLTTASIIGGRHTTSLRWQIH